MSRLLSSQDNRLHLSDTPVPERPQSRISLMRFYDIQRGRILLDGVDLRDWDLKALRENFAVVSAGSLSV